MTTAREKFLARLGSDILELDLAHLAFDIYRPATPASHASRPRRAGVSQRSATLELPRNGSQISGSAFNVAYGSSRTCPIVRRASRSRCASAAAASG
jgi:hypothetical protein